MNSFKIRYSKDAKKFIMKNKLVGIRFMKAFDDIASDIMNVKYYDIVKFKSNMFNDVFRMRIGKYRAIFRVINNELLIFVFVIDSRGGVYK